MRNHSVFIDLQIMHYFEVLKSAHLNCSFKTKLVSIQQNKYNLMCVSAAQRLYLYDMAHKY